MKNIKIKSAIKATAVILFVVIGICSCQTQSSTMKTPISSKTLGEQYPRMYEEKPLTIAVMPSINKTAHKEAKDYFYTALYKPLCEKGYYVFSPYITLNILKENNIDNAEKFIDGKLDIFKDVLGADAVMFTVIKEWTRDNLLGELTVDIEYLLRSTKTGEILYNREGRITLDTSKWGGHGFAGALASIATTALNTATTDKVFAGRACNEIVLSDMPEGKYSPLYGKDKDFLAGKKFIETIAYQ